MKGSKRMTRTHVWTSAAVLGAAALVVAGCGGDSKSSESTVSTGGATGAQPAGGIKKGGTGRFNLQSDTDYVDPALAYYQVSWQLEYATCVKLLNYPDKPGAAGAQLQPEAAQSLPKVSADGKTYTFTVRPRYKSSLTTTETAT